MRGWPRLASHRDPILNLLLLTGGIALVVAGALDALWTTLWPEGRAGPLTQYLASWLHRLFLAVAGANERPGPSAPPRRGHQRLLSLEGPVVLVATIGLWVAVLWAGWTAVFSANSTSLVHSTSRAPAGLVDRIYFTGYALFTLGNGDIVPQGSGWQIATTLVSGTGFVLVTLGATYIIAVVRATSQSRAMASQVLALGRSAEEFVVNAWDGHGFPGLDLQLTSIAQQLSATTQQHRAYPLLHYYHAAQEQHAAPPAVVVLDDALAILRWGVSEGCRPAPGVIHLVRESVGSYLETLHPALIAPASKEPAPPDLARVRAAGVATTSESDFRAAIHRTSDRRRLLRGLLQSDGRLWPPSPGESRGA